VTELIRGRVYGAVLPGVDGEKPYLVVSNNARNRQLPNVLAVRITTSDKPAMDSIVVLGAADKPLIGRVLCDDLIQLWPDEVRR
jgi:mRNA interferase MazF